MTASPFDVGPELPTLITPRLRLRHLTPADVPALFAIFGDPAVTRYWDHPAYTDLAAAETLLARIHDSFRARTLFQWGIERIDTPGIIGTSTLADLDATHRRAVVGYALGSAFWGHGYLAEALPVLLRFAFERLNLHRITADVDPRNAPSIRALERLGFQREGYVREHYFVNDEVCDGILFGLLRAETRWLESGSALSTSGVPE